MKNLATAFLLGAAIGVTGLGSFAAESSKPLEIVSVRWGTSENNVDLTEKVKQCVALDCMVEVPANNAFAGKDPARGTAKKLTVKYKESGQEKTIDVPENKTLKLCVAGQPTQEFTISKALYGTGNKVIDVTDKVRKLCRDGKTVQINNATMGKDPAPGAAKKLYIIYSVNGKNDFVAVMEKKDFNPAILPQATGKKE